MVKKKVESGPSPARSEEGKKEEEEEGKEKWYLSAERKSVSGFFCLLFLMSQGEMSVASFLD